MLLYDLAYNLGYGSVDKMIDEMSALELSRWKAYFFLKEQQSKEPIMPKHLKR